MSRRLQLGSAFAEYDTAGLSAFNATGRAEQLEARRALYDYGDPIFGDAKRRGLEPANRPGWSVAVGRRDRADALRTHAMAVREGASASCGRTRTSTPA